MSKTSGSAPGTGTPTPAAWDNTLKALEEQAGRLQLAGASYEVSAIETSPCTVHCPSGINVKGYVGLIAEGRFDEALALIREANPFPGICGRVCPHPCEEECNRADYGGSVAIRALKRFVADYELEHEVVGDAAPERTGPKVAVIGAGPGGLTTAADLARKNCQVTVYAAEGDPGGMLRWAIPAYRLPRKIVEIEIKAIEALGVKIECGKRIGEDISLADLEKDNEAVFLALGAQKGLALRVPGEDVGGVDDALAFLRLVADGKVSCEGEHVAVIGGGNSAMDASRSALRLGAASVTILYRRTQKEMPAAAEEIDDAIAEGVLIQMLTLPVEVLAEGGKLTGLECIHMQLGEPDDSGRRRPVPIEGSNFRMKVDRLIAAVSQKTDLAGFDGVDGLKINRWGTLDVDDATGATGRDKVYAGGDVVTGPRTIVEAIGAGHRAADAILAGLKGEALVEVSKPVEVGLPREWITATLRAPGAESHPEMLPKSFDEVEDVLTEAAAIDEAKRCLRCGACNECVHCLPFCNKDWVVLSSGALDAPTHHLPLRIETRVGQLPMGENGGALVVDAGDLAVQVDDIYAHINPARCHSCGACGDACAYDAPHATAEPAHEAVWAVAEDKCKGCGACMAVCPVDAISMGFFTPSLYSDQVERALEEATR